MRRAIVLIMAEVIGDFCRDGEIHYKISGVPKDAKYIGAEFDPLTETFKVYFESEKFENIKIGAKFPQIDVVYENV
jgi:hypothetical protein